MQGNGSNVHELRKKGHFAKCCKTKGAGNFAKSRKDTKSPQQHIQRIDDRDESGYESTTENVEIVLTIERDENGQFTMSFKINGNPIKTTVDSVSPVTMFEKDEIKKTRKRKTFFIRELPTYEEYVDFNRRKLIFSRYVLSN